MNKKIDRVGEENINNFGSKMVITNYERWDNVTIYFPEYDWYFKNGIYQHFQNGNIKCPYERRLFNKGYIGEGEFDYNSDGIKYWTGMIKRVYDKHEHEKHPTYMGTKLYKPWHCFQDFGYWHKENYYTIPNEIMELDKDILYKGNKLYSPNTCIYVPHRVNSLFTKSNAIRGDYPIGVTHHKRDNIYEAKLSFLNENNKKDRIYLGRYKTPEEAFQAYKVAKEKYIKEVADEYKPYIPKELYDAMYRYEVEIDD